MEDRIAWIAAIVVCCLATQLATFVAANDQSELNNCHPPSIQKQSVPKGYFIQNTQINLPCIASGDGKLSYSWLKNGEPVNLKSEANKRRMSMSPGIGTLHIYKSRNSDEAVYQCVVVNNCGTSLSTTTMLFHARMAPFPRLSNPTKIKRVLGSSAVLTCKPPVSVPKASVAWILIDSAADQPLTYDEDDYEEGIRFNTVPLDRRVTMDYAGNLYITSVLKEDEQSGKTYVCLAQNRVTRSSNKGEDKVIETRGNELAEMGVDLMWSSQTENKELQGKKAKFKCIFSGQPEPDITWTRVDGEWDKNRMVADHHELVISQLEYGDAGKYRCSGTNVLKPEPKTQTFSLIVDSSPEWQVKPRDVTVGVEESASFDCETVGHPKPDVQWYINGHLYDANTSKGSLRGNTLIFDNLDKGDSQVIQCNASNIHGFIWADVFLYVEAHPPSIVVKPQEDLIVARDKDVTLKCQVTGKPQPKVVWYKGSQPLNHERFKIQDSGDLIIKKTTMKDKGKYTCHATNRFGKESASGKLTVRDKTVIQTEPVSEKVDYSNQITFTCGATTDHAEMKNLRYRWLKDGVLIENNDPRVEINGGVIVITNTNSQDTGAYTCVAENGLDNDTATATLKVKAPPDPPKSPTIEECLAKKANLKWRFDAGMSNFDTMLRYIVETKGQPLGDHDDLPEPVWKKAKTVNYPRKQTMVPITPFANWSFRVRAVNRMGVSEPSLEASGECQTFMAVPDINPANIRTDEKHKGYLVVKWKPMDVMELNAPHFKYLVIVTDEASGLNKTYKVPDYKKGEFRIKNEHVYKPYKILVRSQNQVGLTIKAPEPIIGYSGEAEPKVIPQNFELDPSVNVTATMAGFQWDPVDTSPQAIQGQFRGYKIRFWKKGEKDTSMHEEFIPHNGRTRRQAGGDNKIRGRVMNLPSFSDIIADAVVVNNNFQSEGSNQVNLTTPEGVPGRVKFLEAMYRGSSHLQLNWQSPSEPNGEITGYRLAYRTFDLLDFGEKVLVDADIPPQDNWRTIDGLEPDTQYRVYIQAKTKVGLGSDNFIDVRTASDMMALAPPVIETVFPMDNEANVSWTLDMTDKSSRIGQVYYLEYKKKKDEKWVRSEKPIQDKFWAQLDHLDPGTVYQVRVIAMGGQDKEDDKNTPSGIHMFRTSGIGAARASFLTAAWFIGMMIAIAILILILILVCILKRNRGDNYPVQEKERLRGNCDDNHDQFNDYGGKGDENGIGASSSFDRDGEKVPLDVDGDSMDYGDDDASRFNEDGSFIGQYGTGDKTNDVANVSASSIV